MSARETSYALDDISLQVGVPGHWKAKKVPIEGERALQAVHREGSVMGVQ